MSQYPRTVLISKFSAPVGRTEQGEASGTLSGMSQPYHRRPDPKMTKVIIGTALVQALTWLSGYSGGPVKWWVPLALSLELVLAGWTLSQSGAADKNVLLYTFGLPKNW
jgi:hypothetical protein